MALGKMRVLYYSSKGKMVTLADEICKKFDIKSDVIPPAYPCENEKLLFIGISVGKENPDKLRQFLSGLNKTRAQNVAFFIDGAKEDAAEVINYVRNAGAKVLDEVLYIKLGFSLPFMKGTGAEDIKNVTEWAERAVNTVNA